MTFIGYEPGSKGYQFWDKDSQSIVIVMMTIGHRIQLHLHLVHHCRCPLRHHQVQRNQKRGSHPQRKKPLGQMKSLALPFHQNPICEAVYSEVRDHSITCNQGSDRRFPKQVHPNSLKRGSPPEGPSLELEPEDSESLYATDRGSPRQLQSPSADPLNIGKMLINAVQIDTLSTYKQAMKSPLKLRWQEATRDKYNSLVEMGTWILVSLPKH